MKRQIPPRKNTPFDLVVVGGGIYGASLAYYASLAKLKVALFERDDFCSHTSANSQKVIHGGLRYLQSLDCKRVLESIHERQRFYALFPHLIHPLPCLLPLCGYGTKSRVAMTAALYLYRMLQHLVYRRGLCKHRDKIPHIISKAKTKALFPHLQQQNVRGGAIWYDGLCLEPERVVIGLLKSADARGAQIANYADVQKISRIDTNTLSIKVKDRLDCSLTEVHCRKIALCTGPWLKTKLTPWRLPAEINEVTLIAGVNGITKKITTSSTSVALRPQDSAKSGLLFVLPWKKYSISGTKWSEGGDVPVFSKSSKTTANKLVNEVHLAYPSAKEFISLEKVHFGYVPGEKNPAKSADKKILQHYRLVDLEEGKNGDVLQVVGVKFTTAFDVSLQALRRLFPEVVIDDRITPETLPVGSVVGEVESYLRHLEKRYAGKFTAKQVKRVFQLLGSESVDFFENYMQMVSGEVKVSVTNLELLKGLTCFFTDEEMVVSLSDMIHRRLFPGMPLRVTEEELDCIAAGMASQLGWDDVFLADEKETLYMEKG